MREIELRVGSRTKCGGKTIDQKTEAISVEREIGIRLTVLPRLLRSDFERVTPDFGITRSQWSMIIVVARNPGASQRMVAETLEISEASAGRLIDRLCAEGLLERRAKSDDRRAREVYVTERAQQMLAQLSEVARRSEERIFKGFERQDLHALRGYLDRLYSNLTGKAEFTHEPEALEE